MRWPVGIGPVTPASGITAVEGQEAGDEAIEPCRHLDEVRVDREVDERPPTERHVPCVAVFAVLALGVLDGLVRERVLQLRGRDRDAIDEETDVERPVAGRVVRELARDGQTIRLVQGVELGGQTMGRLEVRESDLDAVVVQPVAQDIDRAALVELFGEPLGELGPRAFDPTVDGDETPPGRRLRLGEEGEQLGGVEAIGPVEVTGPLGSRAPLAYAVSAGLHEGCGDGVLEAALVGLHAATPGMSSRPLTAAEMRA